MVRAGRATSAPQLKQTSTMNRYFAMYHGLHERAAWGVAVERTAGFPKVELLMLCRTEKDAEAYTNLTSVGRGMQSVRDQKLAARKKQVGGGR